MDLAPNPPAGLKPLISNVSPRWLKTMTWSYLAGPSVLGNKAFMPTATRCLSTSLPIQQKNTID